MSLPLVLALIFVVVGRVLGGFINLGDSFKFATNKTCGGGEMKLMRGLETDGTFLPVARLDSGVWKPEEGYRDRIDHHSASSFSLTNVKFNDEGLYEFTCGGERIQLQVIIIDLSVTEGQRFKVPCFFFTAGSISAIKGIKWTLNGRTVLEQDVSGPGSGFSRASVAPDWHLTGDLSLTLDPARPEDQGDFICYIKEGEEEKRGRPGPVRLTVHKNIPPLNFSSPPSDQRPTPGTPEDRATGAGTIFSIVLNVVLTIVAAVFLMLWLRSRRPAAAGAQQRGRDEETIPVNQVQGNGSLHGPTQEAGDDGL